MRIAFLNSWTLDVARGSGTAAAVAGLAKGLKAHGHEVDIIGAEEGASSLLLQRLLYNLELPGRVAFDDFDLIVGFDIDGFHLADLPPEPPFIVYLHGVAADEMRFEHGAPRQYLRALSHLERANAHRARRLIVTSEYSREAACAAYGLAAERVAVVGNGIHPEGWEEVRRMRESASPKEGAPNGTGTILSVARQYPRKNTKCLINAMPEVLAAVPGARLRVVGGGPSLPALEQQVARLGLAEAVTLLGEVAGDEGVRREYAAADIFCLPSLQEGFGIVFLEAMAAGLPVVAARAAAAPEVIGEAGILVPPDDEAALARALVGLLKDTAMREELGGKGTARAERFSWRAVAGRFLEAVGVG